MILIRDRVVQLNQKKDVQFKQEKFVLIPESGGYLPLHCQHICVFRQFK